MVHNNEEDAIQDKLYFQKSFNHSFHRETTVNYQLVIIYSVALNGLRCLKILHENGYSWLSSTCLMTARHRHLKCLKYAHANGCGLSVGALRHAMENKHSECLVYIYTNKNF